MFYGMTNLKNLDLRNATFTKAVTYQEMFGSTYGASISGTTIIVKDATAKSWIEARLNQIANFYCTVTIAS